MSVTLLASAVPISSLAVGIGLGLSVFLSPYTSDRERIKARLDVARGAFHDGDDESPLLDRLARAFSEFDIAEKKMRPVIRTMVTICISTSMAASCVVFLGSIYGEMEIEKKWLISLYALYVGLYLFCAVVVRISSHGYFEPVERLLDQIVRRPPPTPPTA